jgi:hypothetical protein
MASNMDNACVALLCECCLCAAACCLALKCELKCCSLGFATCPVPHVLMHRDCSVHDPCACNDAMHRSLSCRASTAALQMPGPSEGLCSAIGLVLLCTRLLKDFLRQAGDVSYASVDPDGLG